MEEGRQAGRARDCGLMPLSAPPCIVTIFWAADQRTETYASSPFSRIGFPVPCTGRRNPMLENFRVMFPYAMDHDRDDNCYDVSRPRREHLEERVFQRHMTASSLREEAFQAGYDSDSTMPVDSDTSFDSDMDSDSDDDEPLSRKRSRKD